MKSLWSVAVCGAVLALAVPVQAADNAQQERMKSCNTAATGMAGDARKTYMSDCLSGKVDPNAAKMSQQDKMKMCNTKAGEMKGDDRKKFMSECLSAKGGMAATTTAAAPAAAPAAPMSQQDKMKACNTKAGEMKGDDRKKFMSQCLSG